MARVRVRRVTRLQRREFLDFWVFMVFGVPGQQHRVGKPGIPQTRTSGKWFTLTKTPGTSPERSIGDSHTSSKAERFNWIGRAGCVFFLKSFVVRSFRASLGPQPWATTLGLKHEPHLGPRLALASSCERIPRAISFLPTESLDKPIIV
jgi:hypothetical protein